MKQDFFEISENVKLKEGLFKMTLLGDATSVKNPGEFINIKIDGLYLRRPISISDYGDNYITIIYKVVGQGTEKMMNMVKGDRLDILLGLGNGFNPNASCSAPLLIGGGVGIAPLYNLCKKLRKRNLPVNVILGFNKESEIYYVDEFKALGADVVITTVDGSVGIKGFVTDAMDISYDYFYTCGPEPMLKAVYSRSNTTGELSFEKRMGCGFGACMGCTCKTITGYKRICKDGPILRKEEIIWEN